MKRWLYIFLLGCLALKSAMPARAEVPERMMFCGMDLTIDEAAADYIQGVIDKLKMNEARFHILIDRANTYMPFVEEAFSLTGMPDDLKYIVLQESALQGDAVSTSNAVGFWQFKEPTAIEVGLIVNHQVDERKHIFRSSIAAAKYFYFLNQTFDNWIYAVIAYNRGPTGALPFVKPEFFGKREMTITMDIHWYALKAIAHKLAFQDLIFTNGTPRLWLEPQSSMGITSVDHLATVAGENAARFKEFNLWILGDHLPAERYFTYYVPHENAPISASLSDPLKDQSLVRRDTAATAMNQTPDHEPLPVAADTSAVPQPPAADLRFTFRKFEEDPDYGAEFILIKPGTSLIEEAVRADIRAYKLMEWNHIEAEEIVRPGTVLMMKPGTKVKYHIVKKGETLGMIALNYGISESKLAQLNRCSELGNILYQDQKLNLKKAKPAGENIVILQRAEKKVAVTQNQVHAEKKIETKSDPLPSVPVKPDYSFPEFETRVITHTVIKGETLWGISKMYNTTVDVIKMMNKLPDNSILPGQQLQILERIEKK